MMLPRKFIVTSDWHLRSSTPRCRLDDDWIATQKDALMQLSAFANENECDVMCVGDVFHSVADTTFEIVNLVQKFAKSLKHGKLYILAGNHDLPHHSALNLDASAISLLYNSENIGRISDFEDVDAFDFGQSKESSKEFVFVHTLVVNSKSSMIESAKSALEMFDLFPSAKWIFTGDNHECFSCEDGDRKLLNSGCLTIQSVDRKGAKCCAFFVDIDKNNFKHLQIKDDDSKITEDRFLSSDKCVDDKITSFVDRLEGVEGMGLDFVDNVKKSLESGSYDDNFKKIICEILGVAL